MIHLIDSKQLMNEVMNTNQLVIVEFSMENSIPCETQHNTLREIEKEFSDEIIIFKIDIMESQETQLRYQINSTPTILFFQDGKEIERIIGYAEYNKLRKMIEECI